MKSLDNKPSWITYSCPNNCQFDAGVYSCVQVTGTAPSTVPVGDSTVMDVIVDANVDAVVGVIPFNDYDVSDQNGGSLTIRYIEPKGIKNELENISVKYDFNTGNIRLNQLPLNSNITIYNMIGNKIINTSSTDVISLNSYASGIYIVDVLSEKGRKTIKIVKP